MKKLLIILTAALMPIIAGAQAQINTKKVKISDFTQKTTKIVLTGNMFFDASLKDDVQAMWRTTPYEFCTMAEFDALKGNGKGGQQFQIMCLSFDPRNRYGQTRSSAQSITEKVTVRFNWNASTTILKGKRYCRNVLTDGPISRINFCTIPEREIGAEMPIYGTYSESFDDELRPYIERLTHASGEVKCPEAFRLAKKLKDENAEFARLSQSRVFENLSFRANVIAYLKACILYVAHGYRWDKTMEDFIRWSLQYDLWCKMEFFGDAIAAAMHEGDGTRSTRGPQSLLSMLPDAFTLQEVERLRQRLGLSTGTATKNMLSQWKHRGYILQMTEMTNDSFVKSEKYKNK
jgi:hypothetical protein